MGHRNILIAILLGAALAAGFFAAAKLNRLTELRSAFIIPEPIELPDFSLLDHTNRPVNADTFRGQWDLVFFGFTNCPDICPTTLRALASIKRELESTGSEKTPRIVLVSVDPERDTPAVLGQYMDYFGQDNLAITGQIDEIIKLTTALGIYFKKTVVDGDNYSVDHSAAVLLINPDGEFSALFRAPHLLADYVNDLPAIMGGR
ncbi:MAG: SCO family protein [Gammaproteobacteria bacterium]|jgi:protein SCO1|nr:SCO family protein [Gammaproteobacteria bacterium]